MPPIARQDEGNVNLQTAIGFTPNGKAHAILQREHRKRRINGIAGQVNGVEGNFTSNDAALASSDHIQVDHSGAQDSFARLIRLTRYSARLYRTLVLRHRGYIIHQMHRPCLAGVIRLIERPARRNAAKLWRGRLCRATAVHAQLETCFLG